MKAPRVYVDTSVFGGCFDEEFSAPSRRFFDQVRTGRLILLVSEVVLRELAEAPPRVRTPLASLPARSVRPASLGPEAIRLRDAYVARGIVPRRFENDATHVAAATLSGADAIVSWNFHHIVRIEKIRAYNQVNLELGFSLLSIVSPQDIRFDEDE